MKKVDFSGITILIVEDNKDSAFLLEEFLYDTHANLIIVDSGEKAIEYCIENKDIDLVLMDIKIKGISGIRAMEEIRKIRKIPIIAQSSFVYEQDIKKCIDAGFDCFIKKPINSTALIKTIEQFL